jgi:NO-binding membrane sensor protein with MHYT domain
LLTLAYLTPFVGCVLGLACTRHARHARYAATKRSRLGWLGLASVSIGGVGIWVMHFNAMLGMPPEAPAKETISQEDQPIVYSR